MWKCKHCSEQSGDSFDACWSCGCSRDGSPPTEPFEAESTSETLGSACEKPRGKGSKSRDADRATAVSERYRDAYLEASAIIGFGGFVKGIGIILGIMILALALSAGISAGISVGLFGVVIAFVVSVLFYVLGLIISAAGQIVLSTLDIAINTSEFLTRDQRASVMSLQCDATSID